MPWYFFALTGIFGLSITDQIRRAILSGKDKIDYYSAAFLLSLVAGITLIIYTAVVGFVMPPFHAFLLTFAINISFSLIGLLAGQKGLSLLGVGEFTIIMTTRQIITWVLSIVFFGIGLSLLQSLGTLLVMLALVVVFASRTAFKNISKVGITFTALTAVVYGISILTDQLIYRVSDPASYMVIGFTVTVVILALMRPHVVWSIRLLKPSKQGFLLLLVGSLFGLSLVLLFTGLKRANNAPLIGGLFQLQIIISVVLAAIFLRETNNLPRKIIGAIVATIGAVLIVT